MSDFSYVERNLAEVKEDLARIAEACGRAAPTLVCVTKSGSDEELLALVRAGASDIGENRPQELMRRGELLRGEGLSPSLHEIGNLQRNKVKYIIDKASLIHSLDSLSLAEEIERQAARHNMKARVLIEVNSAAEEAKGGVMPDRVEDFYLALADFPHIEVCGLMTMGPVCECEEDIRPYFTLTRKLFDDIKTRRGFAGEGILSMGMSDSYRVAVEEGSTLVRIGRRLFKK
ncbi:MAG: YggS family pyridoxal phosphate-dependent enzyme [Clostridia bacterium]|nr:YggS family pyridoxal phosphate-dependent enzyme [Clostridia bacterium]